MSDFAQCWVVTCKVDGNDPSDFGASFFVVRGESNDDKALPWLAAHRQFVEDVTHFASQESLETESEWTVRLIEMAFHTYGLDWSDEALAKRFTQDDLDGMAAYFEVRGKGRDA